MSDFLTIYHIVPSIGISSTTGESGVTTWTYAQLNGIDNVAEALNEVIQQYQFLEHKGFARNHVTGAAPAWTLSGRRLIGDPAQDYIASVKYGLDTQRQSSFKLEYTIGEINYSLTVPCTLCNIQDIAGGASTDDSVFSVEVRFDGQPTIA